MKAISKKIKQMTTQQGNKLIAEFMGLESETQEWRAPCPTLVFKYKGYWTPVKNLDYHQDWNELMRVVEKIESMEDGGVVTIRMSSVSIVELENNLRICVMLPQPKINAVWQAILQFITGDEPSVHKRIDEAKKLRNRLTKKLKKK